MEFDITDEIHRKIKWILGGILLLTVVVSAVVWSWQKNGGYIEIDNAQIQGSNINISSKVKGTLQEILVADGDMVEEGQAVAVLQVEVSPEQIKELEKNFESAKLHYAEVLATPDVITQTIGGGATVNQAVVDAAQRNLDKATATKDKMANLFAMGAISAMQNNAAQAAYQAALNEFNAANTSIASPATTVNQAANKQDLLRIAELQLKQAQMAYEQSKYAQQSAVLAAPVSGMFNLNDLTLGTKVEAGQNLFTVSNINDVWVEAKINRAEVYQIVLGSFTSYSIPDYPKLSFKGTVFDIVGDEAVDPIEDDMAILKISVPNDSDAVFKPGMHVNLKITL